MPMSVRSARCWGVAGAWRRQQLTVVTRQRLLDLLVVEKVWWRGALDEVRFLERLYDLDALGGTDSDA